MIDAQIGLEKRQLPLSFLYEIVGSYKETEIQRESSDDARVVRHHLATAYQDSKPPLFNLPIVSVSQRVELINKHLQSA